MGKRREFTPEFKQEAVRLVTASGRPISHVARELRVRPDQLRHWKQALAYLYGWDNYERRHSTLGYLSPSSMNERIW